MHTGIEILPQDRHFFGWMGDPGVGNLECALLHLVCLADGTHAPRGLQRREAVLGAFRRWRIDSASPEELVNPRAGTLPRGGCEVKALPGGQARAPWSPLLCSQLLGLGLGGLLESPRTAQDGAQVTSINPVTQLCFLP